MGRFEQQFFYPSDPDMVKAEMIRPSKEIATIHQDRSILSVVLVLPVQHIEKEDRGFLSCVLRLVSDEIALPWEILNEMLRRLQMLSTLLPLPFFGLRRTLACLLYRRVLLIKERDFFHVVLKKILQEGTGLLHEFPGERKHSVNKCWWRGRLSLFQVLWTYLKDTRPICYGHIVQFRSQKDIGWFGGLEIVMDILVVHRFYWSIIVHTLALW